MADTPDRTQRSGGDDSAAPDDLAGRALAALDGVRDERQRLISERDAARAEAAKARREVAFVRLTVLSVAAFLVLAYLALVILGGVA